MLSLDNRKEIYCNVILSKFDLFMFRCRKLLNSNMFIIFVRVYLYINLNQNLGNYYGIL